MRDIVFSSNDCDLKLLLVNRLGSDAMESKIMIFDSAIFIYHVDSDS
ncbi:MAG: hypothetical protein Q8Q54_05150 [Methylococcales bacterium]|nr:hypothetical protein [Methylococcales bacterium]MDP3838292.1 hypothetical protein [Methylococcales bacterium]